MGDITENQNRINRESPLNSEKKSALTAYDQCGNRLTGSLYRNLLSDNRGVISDFKLLSS